MNLKTPPSRSLFILILPSILACVFSPDPKFPIPAKPSIGNLSTGPSISLAKPFNVITPPSLDSRHSCSSFNSQAVSGFKSGFPALIVSSN